ncbi:carbohydrate deacetylase [Paenibacillus sp. Y412MC10]|uniref:carbohydrate deacetylase n=1 Tax=Geobacillus sp. (strain Y412MC10) TaxID=481743 RepID=UPI0016426A85|nr:ChbG/HpnK family deacetylase [Paenibacillus sp. Y412MC10]
MNRQVIINADDFGLSPAVNRGIIEAYRAGGITSTSMMVNMPGLADAVHAARSLPGLGVGLHFNLTYGRPLSDPAAVPSLVRENGVFLDGKIRRSRNAADVAAELDAQWNRFLETSLFPTHLDSHQLLHQDDPVIYRVMAELACRHRIPLRRSQIEHPHLSPPALKMTDRVLLDTYGDSEGLQRLLCYIRSAPDGITEIMCHPGYVDDVLRGLSEWTEIRERELRVFTNPEIAWTMQACSIEPVNFNAMRERPVLSDDGVSSAAPLRKTAAPRSSLAKRRSRSSITQTGRHANHKRRRRRSGTPSGKPPLP